MGAFALGFIVGIVAILGLVSLGVTVGAASIIVGLGGFVFLFLDAWVQEQEKH